jgi:glycosyltransferase involved in cell wall biosynthesis
MTATTTLGLSSAATVPDRDAHEHSNGVAEGAGAPENGAVAPEAGVAVNGRSCPAPAPVVPSRILGGQEQDDRHALAMFCHEAADSLVGQFVARLAAAVAGRQTPVHLFARLPFEVEAEDVHVHVLGGVSEGDLLGRVQDFTHRACNAFLRQFVNGSLVTLMGFEWSAAEALSILHGIAQAPAILSVHSLERQRSDMTSEVSRQIEAIEHRGLREARTVLVHDGATAETAKYWVPECASRIVPARQMFPVKDFRGVLDPGVVKARYQVGPIDPLILFVGDLDERYGPDLLVKAMPAILKNTPQARLVIVGDGGLYWRLRVYTRYLLLEHAVRLPGSVVGKAMAELVQAADVVAVPSREPTPWWPILAAWAAGKPVVATHNAAPGLLEHEQDSVLCYPSENSCVWGIENLLFGADLRRTLVKKGAHKLEQRFGWDLLAEQVQGLMGVAAQA